MPSYGLSCQGRNRANTLSKPEMLLIPPNGHPKGDCLFKPVQALQPTWVGADPSTLSELFRVSYQHPETWGQTSSRVPVAPSQGLCLQRSQMEDTRGFPAHSRACDVQNVSGTGAGLDFRRRGTSTQFLFGKLWGEKLCVISGINSELRLKVLRNRFDSC